LPPFSFIQDLNEIVPILRGFATASTVESSILSEAVRSPTFIDEGRAGEVLEDGLQVMTRFGVATQAPILVELCEE
jgi:hypothetical protein